MNVKSRIFAAVVLALGFASGHLAMSACDNKGPSASVGACHEGVSVCDGLTTQGTCVLTQLDVFVINQDFPTSCVDKDHFNCNTPLAVCYRKTQCIWSADKCIPDPNNNYAWTSKAKRVAEQCIQDDPGENP